MVALLALCNGALPLKNYFVSDEGDEVVVGRMLRIDHPNAKCGMEADLDFFRAQCADGGFVPFCMDNGNANYICEAGDGAIYWWLHDDPLRPARWLAGSLGEFLGRLEDCPF
jgi:hypothetical protein